MVDLAASGRLQSPVTPLPAEVEAPIRSNFIRHEDLEQLGESFANNPAAFLADLSPFDFHVRLKDDERAILEVYRATNEAQARGESITPAAQWLLDNNYLVEETIFQVKRDLPSRFYHELPLISVGSGNNVPRVVALAWLYVAHLDSSVSSGTFASLIQGYQKVQALKIGELWALPSILRFVLIDNLRRLSLRVQRATSMRQIANSVADSVIGTGSEEVGIEKLQQYCSHAGDTAFATQMLYRLRDGSQNAGQALSWLEQELEKIGSDAEETIIGEHHTLSAGNVTTGNIIRGLRLIDDIDWSDWFESISLVDAQLREKTCYEELDFASRDQYRTAIEDLARHSNLEEVEVTRRAIVRSPRGEVGFCLVGDQRQDFEAEINYRPTRSLRFFRFYRKTDWVGIALPVAFLTAALLIACGIALSKLGLGPFYVFILLFLFSIPAIEGAIGLYNTFTLMFLKPTRLIGYEYKEGVPKEATTLVVVPVLIGSRDDIDESVRNLEVHHLANMKGSLSFAMLSDWLDSSVEIGNDDEELLAYARERITELNQRYEQSGTPLFHLLHRRRLWSESEGVWMGWERKRGKLHELNLLLRGDNDTTFLPTETPLPEGVIYVMTLDADTRMARETVTRLVGKMRHPLNQPVLDPRTGRVISGYAIMQPRVTASLTTGDEASFFQRVFSANRGLDPYVFAVSDLYQDVFGQGTFTGKGLYHVDAFEAATAGKIAENSVLSHDLLEGALAKCALTTDVELIEDYPTRYAVDASRHHRWARGDWQLLPYLLNPKSGVPALSRWKMLDNLRRTLTPIFWVMASVAGWALLPFTIAVQWQVLLIVSIFMAQTYEIINAILPTNADVPVRNHVSSFLHEVAFASAHVALRTVFFAHSAWMMLDAIVRTLYRMFVSRKNLLEWRTASQAQKAGANDLGGYYSMMHGAILLALVGLAVPAITDSTGAFLAAIFALFWFGSPAFAWAISRSAETEDRLEVSEKDAAELRVVARRTWLYFETFVDAANNMLPPDNFQETPAPVTAHRTSPTNIGVYLLSIVSARDFGWISLASAAERLDATISTLEKMQRFRGHFYNWYDTQSLHPLLPPYISAVDSGNLAGHLITASQACAQWSEATAAYLQGDFEGVLDATTILAETLEALPDDRRQLRPLRQRLTDRINGMRRAVLTLQKEPETASIRTINLAVLSAEIRKLAASIHSEIGTARSDDLQVWASKLAQTCEAHVADSHMDEMGVKNLHKRFAALHDRARQLAFDMDFTFLYRKDRKLLSIGYRADNYQLDESCYDLLASEARLTSLFAVAKGDLPTEHWFRLGRPLVQVGFRGALISWSGSMFEYLMPPLVMKEPQGGILNQTNNLIIHKQIAYGRSKRIPWGISEAAYNARDREMTYQYTNFGVPGLGLKRGLANNTVIAPYATILAAQFMPREAVRNLAHLTEIGALGRYGFHDAVDYTPSRVPEGKTCVVVRNYMAHHTGMSIVAISNIIYEGRMRERFHSDPVIEAAELLLQEKAVRAAPVTTVRTEAAEQTGAQDERPTDTRIILDPVNANPAVNILSNGHYSVMMTGTGSGYSRFYDYAVSRWNGDASDDTSGTFLFVRDTNSNEWWSATSQPKRVKGEISRAIFSDDKSTFTKNVGSLMTEVEVVTAMEGNGEARRITIYNEGGHDRHIEITSFGEIVLGNEASDNAHPAFSKMFVETEIDPENGAIYATRHKRDPGDPDLALAHFVTATAGGLRDAEAETDRRAFIGRGRTLSNAAAFDPGVRLSGSSGYTLDPIMALRTRVRVPAMKKVALTFWTVVGANRQEVTETMRRLDHPGSFERQSMLAWTHSQVQTRHVDLSLEQAAQVQRLARYLLFPQAVIRMPSEAISSDMGPQSALWPLGISGDYPIMALRISDQADLDIMTDALRLHEYLRARGVVADLVIVNERASSYVQDLQQAIEAQCENGRLRGNEFGPRQHIFAVRRDLMDDVTYRTLLAVAHVVLHARNGSISDQVERAEFTEAELRIKKGLILAEADRKFDEAEKITPSTKMAKQLISPAMTPQAATGEGLEFWNGFGGFDNDYRDYVVRLERQATTPHPWINVIANGKFGFHISSEGAAYTWSQNSRDFEITPWSNDPVSNRPGEALYIHNLDDGSAFAPIAAVLRNEDAVYEARHGQGVSTFSTTQGTLETSLTHVVDADDSVRVSRLVLHNNGARPAQLRLYNYAEWVLGLNRARNASTIVCWKDEESGALLARNPFNIDFGERCAFMIASERAQSVSVDRSEFLGRLGTVELPETVITGRPLSDSVEAGVDPCAAMAYDITLQAGQSREILFLIGDAASPDEARDLISKHLARGFEDRLSAISKEWTQFLDTFQITTPNKALDAMINTWLPYQALSCRLRARSAFYQTSGAYGFRDQLQDTLSLLLHDPSLAKAQILNAAGRQFPEGDVQHWWLPRTGAGVRTTISDDIVWLALGTATYVSVTGDETILDSEIPYITGQVLQPGEHDAFFTPGTSEQVATLYEHCVKGLNLAIERTGADGLPLILGGDWNDGMNGVGREGKGQSVWLGWHLAKTLSEFMPLAQAKGDEEHVRIWTLHLDKLRQALNSTGWDGEWFKRGTYDDGSPLGSHLSDECQIDAIAQSWSVISGFGDKDKTLAAMQSFKTHLVDEELKIVRLFTPSFSKTDKEPGYIKSYPPGVRENGGQYTHGATWGVIAYAMLDQVEEAYELLDMMLPVNHSLDAVAAETYRVEPYVIAADIYSSPDKGGRGGWTWYTGSAGWLYRAATESLLGIEKRGNRLLINPKLPASWPGFEVVLKDASGEYRIKVKRGNGPRITLDGNPVEELFMEGSSQKAHEIEVMIPG